MKIYVYLHVARAKIHLEIHGGVPWRRGAVLAVWRRQMMGVQGMQLLRRVELLMMKGRLMIAAEGVPPRLVPRAATAAGGTPAPRAPAADADPQHATAADTAATTASPSARCELVRAGFNLPPDGSTWNRKYFSSESDNVILIYPRKKGARWTSKGLAGLLIHSRHPDEKSR